MLPFHIVHFDSLETFRFDIETFQDRNFVFDFVSISLTLLITTVPKGNESVAVSSPSLSLYSNSTNTRFLNYILLDKYFRLTMLSSNKSSHWQGNAEEPLEPGGEIGPRGSKKDEPRQ
jgi:hypothetical protein